MTAAKGSGKVGQKGDTHTCPEAVYLDCIEQQQPPRTGMRVLAVISFLSLCLTWTIFSFAKPLDSSYSSQSPVQQFTSPLQFPQQLFASYWTSPTGTQAEPRPKVIDAKTGEPFSESLDRPFPLPDNPPESEAVFPKATTDKPSSDYSSQIQAKIIDKINDKTLDSCQKCVQSMALAQKLARADPKSVPSVLISLCTLYKFISTKSGFNQSEICKRTYSPPALGSIYAQVLSYADLSKGDASSDALHICNYVVGTKSNCSLPAPIDLNADNYLDKWFGGNKERKKKRSLQSDRANDKKTGPPHLDKRGKKQMMKVLHFSDIHIDPRFFVGSEAHCTSGYCCRSDAFNSTFASGPPTAPEYRLPIEKISLEAAYFGSYRCDAPWSLAVSALQSIKELNGGKDVDMSIYSGDMVTHDAIWHVSRDLVRYTEQAIMDVMKKYLGSGPVYISLGNHDSAPSDMASPKAVPDEESRSEFSYDWDNVQRLYEAEGWFTHEEAKQVGKHYGGYSISPRKGLRVIAINTDYWYRSNIYNFINSTNPDNSGILRFLTDELEAAEKRNERVWIMGHVLSGWDGTNPLANPTNLFYQIVDHYSPKTIAHIFFGHTHEDQFNLFYGNNGTERTTLHAKAVSLLSPSITPLTNVNSAFRFYHVNPETYEIMDYDQYYAQVATFNQLPKLGHGPVWKHLYSAREEYGDFASAYPNGTLENGMKLDKGSKWPMDAPLNATFWSALTDEMIARPDVVKKFSKNQARNSTTGHYCTDGPCLSAIPCYARSGSAILGLQCPQGYNSVQN